MLTRTELNEEVYFKESVVLIDRITWTLLSVASLLAGYLLYVVT